jgi:hypothetical protein
MRGHGVLGRCRPPGWLVERDGTRARPKLLGVLIPMSPDPGVPGGHDPAGASPVRPRAVKTFIAL